jgi:hypothetical protein
MTTGVTYCTIQSLRSQFRRGAALVEMAFMLPVLIILLIGMVEFGQFILTRERVNKVTNQLAGALYTLSSTDEARDENLINLVIDQARILAFPLREPTVSVRFCRWKPDEAGNPVLYRVWKNPPQGAAGTVCGTEGPACSVEATREGFGEFVQVYACSTYQPVFFGKFLEIFTRNIPLQNLSYLPLRDTNLVAQLITLPNGGEVPESANCNTNPEMCPQNKELECGPNEEPLGDACRSSCDEGKQRDTTGQCECIPGEIPDGNFGCMPEE